MELGTILIPVGIAGAIAVMSSLRLLYEYQRGVVFRLGKLVRARGPGLIWLLPFGVERMRKKLKNALKRFDELRKPPAPRFESGE